MGNRILPVFTREDSYHFAPGRLPMGFNDSEDDVTFGTFRDINDAFRFFLDLYLTGNAAIVLRSNEVFVAEGSCRYWSMDADTQQRVH